jgi:hypothetical protein
MSIPINPGFQYCKDAKRNVSLEQTEGQCRERHNCGKGPCPLESEFRQNQFSRILALLMPGFRSDPDS